MSTLNEFAKNDNTKTGYKGWKELTPENQVWLINWLQQNFWLSSNNARLINRLEKLRSQLKASINPQIAWEVALIDISGIN